MATQRICDRCGVVVTRLLDGTPRSVVVPPGLPSTNPVDAPVQLEIGLKSGNDLCDPCLVSALIELALGSTVPITVIVQALRDRAKTAGKAGA